MTLDSDAIMKMIGSLSENPEALAAAAKFAAGMLGSGGVQPPSPMPSEANISQQQSSRSGEEILASLIGGDTDNSASAQPSSEDDNPVSARPTSASADNDPLSGMLSALGGGGDIAGVLGKLGSGVDLGAMIGPLMGAMASAGSSPLSGLLSSGGRDEHREHDDHRDGKHDGDRGGKHSSSDRERLLTALKPYLGKRRGDAIDIMLKMLRVADILEVSDIFAR